MSFWLREVIGWALVAIGLAVFFLVMLYLLEQPPQVYPTVSMTVVGAFIFRGGIHLLKVATAARVASEAARALSTPPRIAQPTRTRVAP